MTEPTPRKRKRFTFAYKHDKVDSTGTKFNSAPIDSDLPRDQEFTLAPTDSDHDFTLAPSDSDQGLARAPTDSDTPLGHVFPTDATGPTPPLQQPAAPIAADLEEWEGFLDHHDADGQAVVDPSPGPRAVLTKRDLKVWYNWANLHAAFITRGSAAIPKRAYVNIYNIVLPYKDWPYIPSFPHYSTLPRTIYPHIRKHCLPQVQYRKLTPAGTSIDFAKKYLEGNGRVHIPDLVFVTPSEWARHDIRDPSFFRDVFENNFQSSVQKYREFENSPIVQDRAAVLGDDCIFVSSRTGFVQGYPGDHIRVELDSLPHHPRPNVIQEIGNKGFFEGRIKEISGDQSFLSRTSAGSPIKVRCPGLKAGDVAAVVSPYVNGAYPGTSNVLWAIVFRYWETTGGGRSPQILVKLRLASSHVFELEQNFSIYAIKVFPVPSTEEYRITKNHGVLPTPVTTCLAVAFTSIL